MFDRARQKIKNIAVQSGSACPQLRVATVDVVVHSLRCVIRGAELAPVFRLTCPVLCALAVEMARPGRRARSGRARARARQAEWDAAPPPLVAAEEASLCPACVPNQVPDMFNTDQIMVCCDGCQCWFHCLCMGLAAPPVSEAQWHCKLCIAVQLDAEEADDVSGDDEFNDTLKCNICLSILRDPNELSCCSSCFCGVCIK